MMYVTKTDVTGHKYWCHFVSANKIAPPTFWCFWNLTCHCRDAQVTSCFGRPTTHPYGTIDNNSALVQTMAWRKATSHYLNQWWPSSLTHICITRPQWVNKIQHALYRPVTSGIPYGSIYSSLSISFWREAWITPGHQMYRGLKPENLLYFFSKFLVSTVIQLSDRDFSQ